MTNLQSALSSSGPRHPVLSLILSLGRIINLLSITQDVSGGGGGWGQKASTL